jgi:hypothetical protein
MTFIFALDMKLLAPLFTDFVGPYDFFLGRPPHRPPEQQAADADGPRELSPARSGPAL